MKIFDWVHRKFHRNAHEYMVSPKKDEFACKFETASVTTDIDTNALLNQATLMDVWKDGILTIGTLGFEYTEDEYDFKQEQEVEKQEGPEEKVHSPSVPREKERAKPYADNVACFILDAAIIKPDLTIKVEETPEIVPLLENVGIKKRVTLADLLSTDIDVLDKLDERKLSGNLGSRSTNTENNKKGKKSFGKKSKGEDSRPKGKLQRMVYKMLKKKIYPDLEGKIHGKDGRKDTPEKTIDIMPTKMCKPDEMVSLLPGNSEKHS